MKLKLKYPKLNTTEEIFMISYSIFLAYCMLFTSAFVRYISFAYKPILLFCMLLLTVAMVRKTKIYKWTLLGLIIGFLLLAILFVRSQNFSQLTLVMIIPYLFCARDMSFKKIAYYTIYIQAIILIIVIGGAFAGIIENYSHVRNGTVRYYLGFRYALYGPTYFLNLTMLWVYINQNKIKLRSVALLLIIDYFFFIHTNARSTTLLVAAVLFIGLILQYLDKSINRLKLLFAVLTITSPICAGASIFLTASYNSSIDWMSNLNTFLGNRLAYGQNALLIYGVKFLGQEISMVGNGLDAAGQKSTEIYSYIDSLYVQLLVHYGVIFLILFLAIMTFSMIVLYKRKKYNLLVLMSIIGLHCVIDDMQLYLYYNTFWFITGDILFGRKNKSLESSGEM